MSNEVVEVVYTSVDNANTLYEVVTKYMRDNNLISDPDKYNVSFIPKKLSKGLPFVGDAVAFYTADEGEGVAAVISNRIGDLYALGFGAAIAAASGGNVFAGLAGVLYADVYYSVNFEQVMTSRIAEIQRDSTEYLKSLPDKVVFEMNIASSSLQVAADLNGNTTREIISGSYKLRITENSSNPDNIFKQYEINGVGIAFDQRGNLKIFDTLNNFSQQVSSGEDLNQESTLVIQRLEEMASGMVGTEIDTFFSVPSVTQIDEGLWKIEVGGVELFQAKNNVSISKGLSGVSMTFDDNLDVFIANGASDSFLLVKNGGLDLPSVTIEFSGGIYVMKGALSDVPYVSFSDPALLGNAEKAIFMGIMRQFSEGLSIVTSELGKTDLDISVEDYHSLSNRIYSILDGDNGIVDGSLGVVYSTGYIEYHYEEQSVINSPFFDVETNFTPEVLYSLFRFGSNETKFFALQKLIDLAELQGVMVSSNDSGGEVFRLSNGLSVEKKLIESVDDFGQERVLQNSRILLDQFGRVQGAVTNNLMNNGLAQIVREIVEGNDGNGIVQLTNINTDLGIAVDSNVIQVVWPSEFVLQKAGGYLGSMLGEHLAGNSEYKGIIYSTLLKTLGQHFGGFSDLLLVGNNINISKYFTVNGVDWKILEDFPSLTESFFENLNGKLSSVLGGVVGRQVSDILGVEGVVGEVTSTVAGTVSVEVIGSAFDVIFSDLDGSRLVNLFELGFDFDKTIIFNGTAVSVGDYIQFQVQNALVSYASSKLAGYVVSAESEQAALLGSFGSAMGASIATDTGILAGSALSKAVSGALESVFTALGTSLNPLVGYAIGAFIGQVMGTVIGNLFGDEQNPAAWSQVVYDRNLGEFKVNFSWDQDGGDKALAQSMAQSVIDGVNSIIGITQGTLRTGSTAPNLQIGWRNGEYIVSYAGGAEEKFSDAGSAITHAAFKVMKGFDLVGGHAIVMRAWHNSDAHNIHEFKEDIQIAEAFQNYLQNPMGIIALMMDQPDSELAQSWATILKRAEELELHLPHEKDLDGGWDEILIAQGYDPESLPEITNNDLVITDPITGEQTTIHYVIGPGYEIVRMEGTDGNDIIQVNVDGPSISYVNAGEGNDVVTGSDQADVLVGGTGDDIISGEGGNDWLHGGDGNDTLDGGAGDDFVVGGWGDDTLKGGVDADTVYGGYGNDTIIDDAGVDIIYGGEGDDTFIGNNLEFDKLYGQEGNDTFISYGKDHIYGGEGDDFVDVSQGSGRSTITISRGDGHDVIVGAMTDDWSYIRFERNIGAEELFFKQVGNDLKILVLGENQSVTIKDYYLGDVFPRIALEIRNSAYIADKNGTSYHGAIAALVARDAALSEQPSGEYNLISNAALAQRTGSFEQIWSMTNPSNQWTIITTGTIQSESIVLSSAINQTAAYGSAGNDTLSYSYTEAGNPVYLYGDSGNDTLEGGVLNDRLIGGLGDDILRGYGGADKLYGGAGDDTMYGGGNDDELYGGYGDDYLNGGTQNDILFGDAGNDTLIVQGGDNLLYGGSGDDDMTASEGKDTLYGEDGNDVMRGGAGEDWMSGGSGNDILIGQEDSDTLSGNDGDDYLDGGSGDDYMYGGSGSDILVGGSGDDTLSGGIDDDFLSAQLGDDVLEGGLGNDTLDGGIGNDWLRGGEGNDAYLINDLTQTGYLAVNRNNTDGRIQISSLQGLQRYGISVNVHFRTDALNSHAGIFSYNTQSQDNAFSLTNPASLIVTINGYQKDTGIALNDGEWHDLTVTWASSGGVINVYDFGELIYSGARASGQQLLLTGTAVLGQEQDSVGGGFDAGQAFSADYRGMSIWNKTLSSSEVGSSSQSALYRFDFTENNQGSNLVNLNNSATSAQVFGDVVANSTYELSQTGTDIIQDGVGNDKIVFGEGIAYSDLLFRNSAENAHDLEIVMDGHVLVKIENYLDNSVFTYMEFSDGTGRPLNFANFSLNGNEESNTLTGGAGNDIIVGHEGDDILSGGGQGNDQLVGGNGNDSLFGGMGNDLLFGDDGNDILYGRYGDDLLYGGQGDDVLSGGGGNDILTGYTGADTFVLSDGDVSSFSTITDFNLGEGDKLDISNILYGYDPASDAITDFVEIVNSGSDSILKIDKDGLGTQYSAEQIAKLNNINGLTDEQSLVNSGNLLV